MEGEKERRGGAEYLTTNYRTFDILCHSPKIQKSQIFSYSNVSGFQQSRSRQKKKHEEQITKKITKHKERKNTKKKNKHDSRTKARTHEAHVEGEVLGSTGGPKHFDI